MPTMGNQFSDQFIAADILISSKQGIKQCASALSECASPNVRDVIVRQLQDAIKAHETISNYMVRNGMYYTQDLKQQFQLDITTADQTLNQISGSMQ